MNNPKNLKYAKTHEWVKMIDDSTALIGITNFAQDALGDIVFVNLPEPGDSCELETSFADIESVKAVSDILSPFTATVSEINEAVIDSPELINSDPYGTWLIKVENITDQRELLDVSAYELVCETEE
ncbi:MAG: glycine cleavage system protein GcvH [Clostridia bacterium]|nr:glycine cleavage system protein GcvH [Clostridia bacterium]MDD4571195.1 glycine cleavage system protein GcvH [Clostridia bacterium]